MGAPVGAAQPLALAGSPSRRTAPSSSTRCAGGPSSRRGGGSRCVRPRRPSSAPRTSAACSRRSSARSSACTRCRRASTWTSSGRSRATRRSPSCSPRRARDPPNPGNAEERQPDEGNAERLATFLAGDEPTVVYFGKLLYNKGVHVLLEALAGSRRPRRDRRLRRLPRGARGGRAAADALHRRARAPAPRPPAPARRRRRRALDLPGGVRHGGRRGRGGRGAAARRAPLGPGGDRGGARGRVPRRAPRARVVHDRRRGRARARSSSGCSRSRRRSGRGSARPRGAPPSRAGAGPASPAGCCFRFSSIGDPMGDEQRLPYDALIERAREAFDAGTDFTVAVEEEFALLDPESLDLVNRFEELQDSVRETPLEEHLVGELIASEVEVKTGRCDDFGAAAALMGERRAQLAQVAGDARDHARRDAARTPGAAGRTSGSSTRRTTAATTSSSATSSGATTRSGSTSTSASAAPTGRCRSATGCGRSCRPARAVRELAVRRGRQQRPPLRPHGDLHAHVPALRRAGRVRELGRVRAVRALPLRDGLDHRAHAALVERAARTSPSRRSRSGSATRQPDLAEARSLAALALRAHLPDRARARRGRAAARCRRTG